MNTRDGHEGLPPSSSSTASPSVAVAAPAAIPEASATPAAAPTATLDAMPPRCEVAVAVEANGQTRVTNNGHEGLLPSSSSTASPSVAPGAVVSVRDSTVEANAPGASLSRKQAKKAANLQRIAANAAARDQRMQAEAVIPPLCECDLDEDADDDDYEKGSFTCQSTGLTRCTACELVMYDPSVQGAWMEYRNECFRQLQRDRAANARARQTRANAAIASGFADDSSSCALTAGRSLE